VIEGAWRGMTRMSDEVDRAAGGDVEMEMESED